MNGEPTVRLRKDPQYGMPHRCWVNWLLSLLILALLFVSTANAIMLWKMTEHVKVVKVERVSNR